jgi:hypothetical protein
MGTSYKAQIDNEKEKYKIKFGTTNYDSCKMIERACQKAIDIEDEAAVKERYFQSQAIEALYRSNIE